MLLALLLSACGEQAAPEVDYFIPPTLAPQASPVTIATATEIAPKTPTPTIECTNNLLFIDDKTIPDGTAFEAGAEMDKVWLVENNGTCNWDTGYTIQLVSGDPMGAEEEQALFPARSGSEADIRIVFTAPDESGDYRSQWQAFDPDGNAFGDPIFIIITVE
jgi:hypothetical protein